MGENQVVEVSTLDVKEQDPIQAPETANVADEEKQSKPDDKSVEFAKTSSMAKNNTMREPSNLKSRAPEVVKEAEKNSKSKQDVDIIEVAKTSKKSKVDIEREPFIM